MAFKSNMYVHYQQQINLLFPSWNIDLKNSWAWVRVWTPPFPIIFLSLVASYCLSFETFHYHYLFFYIVRKYGAVVTVCVRACDEDKRREKKRKWGKKEKRKARTQQQKNIDPIFLFWDSACTTNKLDGLTYMMDYMCL